MMKRRWKFPLIGLVSAMMLVGCNEQEGEQATANTDEPLVVV